MAGINAEPFHQDPAGYLIKAIRDYTLTSPGNRLSAFAGEAIFEEPLVGFADGDDPLFERYKTIIGDYHLTPREVLVCGQPDGPGEAITPDRVSVISLVMPIAYQTRLSLRRESLVPSQRWNHTRWQGEAFIEELSRHVVSLLAEAGYRAVAPALASCYEVKERPTNLAANWSHRHAAYAAGLGTFSLNDALITPRGIAMRCGSVVTDAPLPPSPRTYPDHLANCLFYRDGSCRNCIERCPVGAISERGHDKPKCRAYISHGQKEILKQLGREEGYLGRYPACGLCQTKVPCEARIPSGTAAKPRTP
ncbi:MAG: epoxyqueuosine reductase [Chloroflexota bacterium]